MTWTCLEFVEVQGFKDADLGSDVQVHLGGCPALSMYSILVATARGHQFSSMYLCLSN
jgi:hypothetical protein